MQQRENEIRTQRNVEVVRSEIIVCPKREKNEGGNPDGCDQARKIFFGDSQPEQSRIDQKEIAQNQYRPRPDCGEGKKVKRPEHGESANPEGSARERIVQFSRPLACKCSEQEQNFEAKKHRHWNQCF